MKNYKFSLESVLKVRKNEEKNVLETFVGAQNRLIAEETQKEKYQEEMDTWLERRVSSRDIQSLMMENLYKLDLEKKIKKQEILVEEKRQELEEVRVKLQAAQKDKKIIEKLKEKNLEDYKTELSKKNQKEIDEFAVLRYKPDLGVQ